MASKETAGKKHSESAHDGNTNTNGAVITVYVESATPRSTSLLEDPIEKTKPRPRAAGTQGYDRRAQLLAHSRELRNGGSKKVQVQLPSNQSRPKIKKRTWLTHPVRICSCSPSTQMPPPRSGSRSRYERVASKESRGRNRSKKRKASGENCSPLLTKLKNMLKELSCKEIKW